MLTRLVGRRGSKYPQLCCGTSMLVRNRAGMALLCGSASQAPSACPWERQDGPRALKTRVLRPPNFKASALSAPMPNSGKKPNHKTKGGERNLPLSIPLPFYPHPVPKRDHRTLTWERSEGRELAPGTGTMCPLPHLLTAGATYTLALAASPSPG